MNAKHEEFKQLLTKLLEGPVDQRAVDRLSQLCLKHPELGEEYAAQVQIHALLHWQQATTSQAEHLPRPPVDEPHRTRGVRWRSVAGLGGIAVAVAIAVAIGLHREAGETLPYQADIQIIVANDVRVSPDQPPLVEDSQYKLRTLGIEEGRLLFRMQDGTDVRLIAPARIEFLGPHRLRMDYGKLTARVADGANELIVETKQTQIVDFGTVFGVDAGQQNLTDVVVFEGMVELRELFERQPAGARRFLIGGEAARVDSEYQVRRISHVLGTLDDDEWTTQPSQGQTVFHSITDNLRDPSAMLYYRILPGGMREDATAYVRQRHQWNGLKKAGMPTWLLGADLIETLATHKLKPDLQVQVTLARPATLYVLYQRDTPTPEWLQQGFVDTREDIGLDVPRAIEIEDTLATGPGDGRLKPFRIWRREVDVMETVLLGPVSHVAEQTPALMYGLAAKAHPAE